MIASDTDGSDFKKHYKEVRDQLIASLYDYPFQSLLEQEEISWNSDEDFANEAILKAYKKAICTQKDYYENPWESEYVIDIINKIKETNLYKFLEQMPKGAILHVHPTSMGDYYDLLKTAVDRTWDGKTYWVNLDEQKILLRENPPDHTYTPLKDAYYDPDLHHRLINWFVFTPGELDRDCEPWECFSDKIGKVHMLLKEENPELCFHYFYHAFSHLLTVDNIMHVELRMVWRVENETKPGTRENIILNALAAVNKDFGSRTTLTLKTIWSDSRSFGNGCSGKERDITNDIIYVGRQIQAPGNQHLIGYDLVSEEENGRCNYYLLKDISTAYAQLEGALPPFFWHDGESELPPDYDPHFRNHSKYPRDLYFNNNLIDAYLMNTSPFQNRKGRVGHGIELFKTPALLNQYREAGLHIELCPVSNQFLKYMKDLGEHPGQAYLAAGIPVSLSPDDPALYSYQGVTIDFWEACIAWDIDLKILKVLAYYSLKHSGLSPQEKETAIKKWKFLWDEFIKQQIAETIP